MEYLLAEFSEITTVYRDTITGAQGRLEWMEAFLDDLFTEKEALARRLEGSQFFSQDRLSLSNLSESEFSLDEATDFMLARLYDRPRADGVMRMLKRVSFLYDH